jgi:hypothetical protein
MGAQSERSAHVEQGPAQPETVAALPRKLHVDKASAMREVDALRAWLRDNIPNTALRVSIRRNGYGILLDQQFGRLAGRSCG